MKLPTREECMQMLDEQKVHDGLKEHTFLVTKIAVFLADELKKKGIDVNTELVEKAALLHDMDKLQCLGDNCKKHGTVAHDILIEKGFAKELAELIKYHVVEGPKPADYTWELKALRYADARALRGDVVSVKERLAYTLEKYPFLRQNNEFVSRVMELEQDICKKIGLNPEQIAEMVR